VIFDEDREALGAIFGAIVFDEKWLGDVLVAGEEALAVVFTLREPLRKFPQFDRFGARRALLPTL